MIDVSTTGIIKLTRGDSFEQPLFINNGTDISPIRHTLGSKDTLYFALLEPNQRFEDAILKKVYNISSSKSDSGDILIKLNPEDTSSLVPGKYFYTVKMRTLEEDGSYTVRTIISEHEFWILK